MPIGEFGSVPVPIGEFGSAPVPIGEGNVVLTTPLYWMYEMSQAAVIPARALADVGEETSAILRRSRAAGEEIVTEARDQAGQQVAEGDARDSLLAQFGATRRCRRDRSSVIRRGNSAPRA